MATIRAGWKRVVQIRPYESETLELSVEKEVNAPGMDLVAEAAAMDAILAKAGDALVLERLMERKSCATAPEPRVPRGCSSVSKPDDEADEYVR